ncbi:hypothetical protein UFOVP29_175 [uncultured Caudovirales phage]|uniref:Uncharacterized protein n=1 Tax=uncultured Caudovirales phage TaxID=2100421 RepID=A0A6J5KP30_9CAUD|nr:hypothetical protein UFOVP29_175 [uncultured Caudovirales phage]
MTHTDQMRQMIALLESAPTTEGAINNTDFELVKFMDLLNGWRKKLEGLKQATDHDGVWARFLNKKGLPDAASELYEINVRLDEVLVAFNQVEREMNIHGDE